jgi:hypothetical protein
MTNVHDLILYYDPFDQKKAICINCFFIGEIQDLPIPSKVTKIKKEGKLMDFINGKYDIDYLKCESHKKRKEFGKGNKGIRNDLLFMFKWYLKLISQLNVCSNPQCNNVLHEEYLFRRIFDNKTDFIAFTNLLKNEIAPIFLCCSCIFDKDKFKRFRILE